MIINRAIGLTMRPEQPDVLLLKLLLLLIFVIAYAIMNGRVFES